MAIPHSAEPAWPLRSLLFVPAHRIDWVRKVAASQTDAVILDLEDSVPSSQKSQARALIAEEIALLRMNGIVPFVRTNGIGHGCETDLVSSVIPGLAGIMLPKTDSPLDIQTLDELLFAAETSANVEAGTVGIIPLPETAKGMWLAYEIAAASKRVSGLITAVSGPVSGDVSRAFGFEPSEEGSEQLFLQSRIILASRAAGAHYPVGTLMGTGLGDLAGVERLALRARRLGFSGAVLIHPSHVPIANRVFRPGDEEVEYSRGLIDAINAGAAKGAGAVSYRGMMVDAAMVPTAIKVMEADARYRALDARFSEVR